MKTRIAWILVLVFAFASVASAEMIFDGKVSGDAAVSVTAPFGGEVTDLTVRAGDRVKKGEVIARIKTTYVYAPVEGKISGVFGEEGDATESISERYGAVLYVEPTNKYTVAATTDKAYNDSANKFIHVGETVYMRCTVDGTHRGTGRVISVAEDGGYKVEATGGEFCISESVGIFRSTNYITETRIGLGTVKATSPVGVKGSGSIIKMHVKNGDLVERGELLFETAEGALDGLYAPSTQLVSEVSGIVTSVDAAAGASVAKGAKVLTVLPDDEMYVEISVLESDLAGVNLGAKVRVDLSWNADSGTRLEGTVARISYVNGATSGEPSYSAFIHFTPDSDVRMGMSALVYVSSAATETIPSDGVPDLSIPAEESSNNLDDGDSKE